MFTVRASQFPFRDSEAARSGWRETEAVARALRARAIVFQSPEDFGPTPENTRAVYAFFERIRGAPWLAGWEVRGPWPTYILEKICSDLGLVHVVDPTREESVTIGVAYFRLSRDSPEGTRHGSPYTDDDFGRVRDIAGEYDDAYVLFDGVTAFDDAVRFRRWLDVPG